MAVAAVASAVEQPAAAEVTLEVVGVATPSVADMAAEVAAENVA
jgi:hypothetical protein